MSLRDFFTAEQIDLIPGYQEKWRRFYLNPQPIDRIKAAAAVQQAYRVMGKPEPEVIFCPSPRAALDRLQTYISQVDNPLPSVPMSDDEARDYYNSFQYWADSARLIFKSFGQGQKAGSSTLVKLQNDLENSLRTSLEEYISTILPKNLTSQQIVEYNRRAEPRINFSEQEQEDFSGNFSVMFERQIPWFPGKGLVSIFLLEKMVASLITMNVRIERDDSGVPYDTTESYNSIMELYNSTSAAELEFLSENPPIDPWDLTQSCIWIDFAISVLNFPYDRKKWRALKELAEQCGWIFPIPMSKFCIVCDRSPGAGLP
jgi:hypothetical protein